jgi:hypothetical protein
LLDRLRLCEESLKSGVSEFDMEVRSGCLHTEFHHNFIIPIHFKLLLTIEAVAAASRSSTLARKLAYMMVIFILF